MQFAAKLTAFAIWCWLAMMLTHELGHVLAAWLTGGRVVYVNVYPGSISSTLVRPNPAPHVVLWGGFATGWLAPQAIAWVLFRWPRLALPARAWAAFCWLAGGIYLAAGGLETLSDTSQLAAIGWPLPVLIALGALAACYGYFASRKAWPALLRDLGHANSTLLGVAIAFVCLAAWIAAQWALAAWLESIA